MRNVCFLVVDDSAVIRKLVRKAILNRLGANTVLEAENGSEVFQLLEKVKVDFILSGWEMQGISGEELVTRLRKSEKWKNIPFIMMTAHDERDFFIAAFQHGVSEYLVKPFSIDELEDKIYKCWNAANKRKSRRYSYLPKHQVTVKLTEQEITAQIANISHSGLLLSLDYNENLHLFENVTLSLELEANDEHEALSIAPLEGKVVRLQMEGAMDQSSKSCLMAIVFSQSTLKKNVEKNLNALLDYLGSLDPEHIHE